MRRQCGILYISLSRYGNFSFNSRCAFQFSCSNYIHTIYIHLLHSISPQISSRTPSIRISTSIFYGAVDIVATKNVEPILIAPSSSSSSSFSSSSGFLAIPTADFAVGDVLNILVKASMQSKLQVVASTSISKIVLADGVCSAVIYYKFWNYWGSHRQLVLITFVKLNAYIHRCRICTVYIPLKGRALAILQPALCRSTWSSSQVIFYPVLYIHA